MLFRSNAIRCTAVVALLLAAGAYGCSPKPQAAATAAVALPFIENDFSTALARAREAKLPLFVEVWAPW